MKKERNKLRKKIKKHYATSGRKYKNDLEKECNTKIKKYLKKYVIKNEKKYKNEFENEIEI